MTDQRAFTFPGISTRVCFGSGTLALVGAEIERLGRSKALVLSTEHQAEDAKALATQLGKQAAGVFSQAQMHTPVDVTDRALAAFKESGADCVVAIGGGSTTGLGKAIALRTGVDQVVIPTTYAGSEMTDILGETDKGEKKTVRDPAIRPETVIYDVDLTLGLPVSMTVTSALNAIAHGVEGLYAKDRSPIIELAALDAMRAIKRGLPAVCADPRDTSARSDVLFGAWLCSMTLGYVTMALHHKLCHVLGGAFNTPHAETHAIILPHAAGFNAAAVPDLLAPVAEIFGDSVGGGIWDFAKQNGAPMRLRDLGLSEADLDRAAQIATQNPYENPRAFSQTDITELLQSAWLGQRPEQ